MKRFPARQMRWVLYILPFVPIALLTVLIVQFSVNVLYGDEWQAVADVYVRMHESDVSLDYLISQHNESRKLFPRLLWMALSFIHVGDHRYHLMFPFLLACGISWMIYRLGRATLNRDTTSLLVLMILANMLIFCPNQYDNWLWGIQLVVFAPIFCILAGISVCRSRWSVAAKFIWCVLLCTISTFTYANGMLCWVLLSIMLFAETRHASERKDIWWAVYLSVMFLNLFVYFWDYHKPLRHPAMGKALARPFALVDYVTVFLGNSLGSDIGGQWVHVAFALGLVLLVGLAVLCAYIVWRGHHTDLIGRALPWMLLAGYVLASAGITAVGRLAWGRDGALASRYVTVSIYLPVTLIFLSQLVGADLIARGAWRKRSVKVAYIVAATVLVVLACLAFRHSVGLMSQFRQKMLGFRAAVAMLHVLPNDRYLDNATIGYPDTVITRGPFLMEHGYLDIPVLRTRELTPRTVNGSKVHDAAGSITSAEKNNEGYWLLEGWAWLLSEEEPPSAILFAYAAPGGKWIAFDYVIGPYANLAEKGLSATARQASNSLKTGKERSLITVCCPKEERSSVNWFRLLGLGKHWTTCGWKYYVNTDSLPKGDQEISAWAFDALTGEVYRLSNAVRIHRNP